MASEYVPQFSSVNATGSTTYSTFMGSIYLFNEGPNVVTISFDAGAGGTYAMQSGEGLNLDNISFLTLNYTFAGAADLRISALQRGS